MRHKVQLSWRGASYERVLDTPEAAQAHTRRMQLLLRALYRLPQGSIVGVSPEGPLRGMDAEDAAAARALLPGVGVYLADDVPPGRASSMWGLFHVDDQPALVQVVVSP